MERNNHENLYEHLVEQYVPTVTKNGQDILENLCVHSNETKHCGRLKTHVYMTI